VRDEFFNVYMMLVSYSVGYMTGFLLGTEGEEMEVVDSMKHGRGRLVKV